MKLTNLVDEYNNKKRELSDHLSVKCDEYVLDGINELDLTGIKSIDFTAYTPYFNDGDSCDFSFNEYGESVVEVDGEEYTIEDGYDDGQFNDSKLRDREKEVRSFLAGKFYDIEEFIQGVYGDHIRITVFFDIDGYKIVVEDYNHD